MALEVINDGPASPDRLAVVLDLVRSSDEPLHLEQLAKVTMPTSEEPKIFSYVIRHLIGMKLVESNDDFVAACKIPNDLESAAAIKTAIISQSGGCNILFAQYSAWLLIKSSSWKDDVTMMDPAARIGLFNKEIGADKDENSFNTTKERAFRSWGSYVGFGFELPKQGFISLPTRLLANCLEKLLSKEKSMPAKKLILELAKMVPFFDEGSVFRAVSKATETQSTISNGLSSAFRELHDAGLIELKPGVDATEQVLLHKDTGHKINEPIFEIRRIQ